MTTPPHPTPPTETETQFQRYPLLLAQIKEIQGESFTDISKIAKHSLIQFRKADLITDGLTN